MAYEQDLIRKIEAGISAVKGKRKSPQEAKLASFFSALKPINDAMYEDLIKQYKNACEIYNTNSN